MLRASPEMRAGHQVEKLAGKECHCGQDSKRLSNLSYSKPPQMSLGPLFHGGTSPIFIPIPALSSPLPGSNIWLPSSSKDSLDKENSVPGSEQSSQVVSELIPIIKEDHLDIGGESGHVMAWLVQHKLVCSILAQCCKLKAHPSLQECFHPYPHPGDGADGFLFGHQGQGEQNVGGGAREWI